MKLVSKLWREIRQILALKNISANPSAIGVMQVTLHLIQKNKGTSSQDAKTISSGDNFAIGNEKRFQLRS